LYQFAALKIRNKYLADGLSSFNGKPRPCDHFKKIKEHDEGLNQALPLVTLNRVEAVRPM